MEFIVITGPNYRKALPKINRALSILDGVELRIDLFKKINLDEISSIIELCRKYGKKIIITKRTHLNGGGYKIDNLCTFQEQLTDLDKLKPDYIDIESILPDKIFESINYSKIIVSHHDYKRTPRNLDNTLDNIKKENAYAYKICTTAIQLSDSYRMLNFIHKQNKNNFKFIGICMGDYGKITRESGISAGNYLTYKILHLSDKISKGITFA